MSTTASNSAFSLFLEQPLLLWSFLIGVVVLVTAVTLYTILGIRRRQAKLQQQAQRLAAQAAKTAVSPSTDTPNPEPLPLDESIAVETPASDHIGKEADSRLADIFQEDIIVDPHVQALRESLPDMPMADLLAQVRQVANQLRQQFAAEDPALEEVA